LFIICTNLNNQKETALKVFRDVGQKVGPQPRVNTVGGALLSRDIFRSAIGLGRLFKDMNYQKGVCWLFP
jgi:hypothetical protein